MIKIVEDTSIIRNITPAQRFKAEFKSIVKLFGSGAIDENVFVTMDISKTGMALKCIKGSIYYNPSSILEISIPKFEIHLLAKFVRKEKKENEVFLFVRILDLEQGTLFRGLIDALEQGQKEQLLDHVA